ncbi:hypothetical protein LX87_05626 [Larkinella arboricola]|uniref:Uncharacterized protein n=1 Tax=Larkinella arboricola TaxID=643671 RepID=A0A327WGI7_LARAB|nr:hypothetical protein [Larkinella arboricola]RAJ89892.1 hypothetical protein LX87_05626 [Larkinella arboricola]
MKIRTNRNWSLKAVSITKTVNIYQDVTCYKDDFQNLHYLNQCRKAVQDTVFNLAGVFFIKNTRNFPNHAGADEQDWDYIAKQNTLIYFAVSDQRHAIRNIDIKRSLDLGSFFRTYSIKQVRDSTNSKMVLVEGSYNSLDLGELKSFYEWCKTQSYHQKTATCTYRLQSSNNVKQTVTITYHKQGEFFYLDIS